MRKFGFETIESEIRKEKAEALGRAGQYLEHSLRELEMVRQECFGLLRAERQFSLAEYERKVTDYGRLRKQAQALRHALIIQREALGLSRHEDVDRQYPLPGPLPFMTHDED